MNRRLLKISLFILIPLRILGQENQLYPCVDFSSVRKQIKSYNEAFDVKIKSLLKDDFVVRFIAKPSFYPEYLFQVERLNKSKGVIHTFIFQESLWESKNRDSVKVKSYERDINIELANKIDILFKIVTDSAKINRNASIIGFDGNNYFFIRQVSSSEMNCGNVWSPSETNPLGELVDVCEELIKYSRGEDVIPELLNEKISKLSLRLE